MTVKYRGSRVLLLQILGSPFCFVGCGREIVWRWRALRLTALIKIKAVLCSSGQVAPLSVYVLGRPSGDINFRVFSRIFEDCPAFPSVFIPYRSIDLLQGSAGTRRRAWVYCLGWCRVIQSIVAAGDTFLHEGPVRPGMLLD